MRRICCFALLLGFIAVLCLTGDASAKFSKGDQSKLRGYFSVLLDKGADERERTKANADFLSFWDKRRVKLLKDIPEIAEIMASCAKRPDSRKGVLMKVVDVKKDLGITDSKEKYQYIVSVPAKYRSSMQSPAWPVILCIPDEGEKASDYLEKYWKNEAIRDGYIIAVFGHDYKPVKVMQNKEVKEDDKVTIVKEEVEAPFTWDCDAALNRFWGGAYLIQAQNFKIDPNRIILDGCGRGASGALTYAAASSYRFAGLIIRGGELDAPTLSNLANLKIVSMPSAKAGEGTAKTLEALRAVMGEGLLVEAPKAADTGLVAPAWDGGGADATALKSWLDGATRDRYPLPSKWTRQSASEQYGYWVAINRVFDDKVPSEITVNSDRKRRRVDVEAKNVERFSLYLNDIIVDLDKPFDLFVNGEKINEYQRTRQAEQLLNHAINNPPFDVGAVFTAEIAVVRLEAPPVEVPKDDGEKDEGK